MTGGVVEAAIVNALLSYGVSVGTGIVIASAVTTVGAAVVLGVASRALTKQPSLGTGPGFSLLDPGRLVTGRDAGQPHQVVYGRTRVSAAITFMALSQDRSVLHLVLTIAGHPVEAIEECYFGDELVPLGSAGAVEGRFFSDVQIYTSLGDEAAGVQPFPDLVAEDVGWTDTARQSGRAKAWVRLGFSAALFPSGVPNITFVVKGRKVYDPRESGQTLADSSSWSWSDNPALCVADYLRNVDFGLAASTAEIDEDALIAAATVCDESVTTLGHNVEVAGATGTPVGDMTDDAGDGQTLAAAFDGGFGSSSSDGVAYKASRPGHLGKDWGSGQTKIISGFRVAQPQNVSALGVEGFDKIYYTLQGSADNSTWVDLSERIAEQSVRGRMTTVRDSRIHTFTAYRYHRVKVEVVGVGTGLYIAEVTFWERQLTQARYTCNGPFKVDQAPRQVIEGLATSFAGSVVWSGGKWYIHAGAWRAPTVTLQDGDWRGGLRTRTLVSQRELPNGVKGLFLDRDAFWQVNDFPSVSSATALSEDGDERRWSDVAFPFTDTAAMAQRLASIELQKARRQITLEAAAKLTAWQLVPPDVVQITRARYGWSDKTFEIVEQTLSLEEQEGGPAIGVDLALRETDANVYAWTASSDEVLIDPAPRSNLSRPADVPPPSGLLLADEVVATSTGTAMTRLVGTIVPSDDAFVDRIEAQLRQGTSGDWVAASVTAANRIEVPAVTDGAVYQMRVRAVTALGARSDWLQAQHTVVGQTAPPADVSGFAVNITGTTAHLSWDPVADADLSHYLVRFTDLTAGASWNDGIEVAKPGRGANSWTLPAQVGSYMIKAVDYKGNRSSSAAVSATTVPALAGFNAVTSIVEHSGGWNGTHSNTAAPDGSLKLDSADTIDGWADIDSISAWDMGGGGALASDGTYTFSGEIDLGAVYDDVRLEFTGSVVGVVVDNNVDDWASIDVLASVDGGDASKCTAWLEVRTTEDDPAGSPTWSDWRAFSAGDFRMRAAQFRLRLTTEQTNVTPLIDQATVPVDMPDRVEAEQGKTAAAGGTAIAYPTAFRATPALGITGVGMATGDYFTVTSEAATGFSIRFFNAAGTGVERTFNYTAKGYGRAA